MSDPDPAHQTPPTRFSLGRANSVRRLTLGFGRGPLRRQAQILAVGPRLGAWLSSSVLLTMAALLGGATPGQAAERVFISYDILERSLPLSSLEAYARNGTVDQDLAVYAKYAPLQELRKLQKILNSPAKISPVAVSQFLYSPQGELLLQKLGQVIQPESRIQGDQAIRAALILAAEDSQGLSLLNVVRKFPSPGLRIDVEKSLEILGQLDQIISLTNQATEAIAQAATREQQTEAIAPTQLKQDLGNPGFFQRSSKTLELVDSSRPTSMTIASQAKALPAQMGRSVDVDIYWPKVRRNVTQTVPVIVISHGLGSDRSTFAYLAEHLASHGFAVLVPEHAGSNARQIESLLTGTSAGAAEDQEFENRPLDITFLLNAMQEKMTQSPESFPVKLNLNQVGVVGQSFGGYTALVLGGAPINLEKLAKDCPEPEATTTGAASSPHTVVPRLQTPSSQRPSPRLQRQTIGNKSLEFVTNPDPSRLGIDAAAHQALEPASPKLRQKANQQRVNFNISLLLQCQARDAQIRQPNLRDPRVKAVLAVNPVTSSLLGPSSISQIQVPTMIVTGNGDTVAPAFPEQIQPFSWLTTPYKYLVMIEGGTHFSTLAPPPPNSGGIPLPDSLVGSNTALARRYLSAMSLAFFKTHVADQPAFQPYLSATYAAQLSESAMPLRLVRSLDLSTMSAKPDSTKPDSTKPDSAKPDSAKPETLKMP